MKSLSEAHTAGEEEGTEGTKKFRTTASLIIGAIGVVLASLYWATIAPAYVERHEQKKVVEHALAQKAAPDRGNCTKSHPCKLTKQASGATEVLVLESGRTACFDPDVWENMGRLRPMISYLGRDPVPFGCSKDAVEAGTCTQYADRIWFLPEPGMQDPIYWIVRYGSSCTA